MFKHLWSIVAQRAIVDQQNNTVSLLDVVEELTFTVNGKQVRPPEGTAMLMPFHHEIVSQWTKEEGEEQNFVLQVDFVDPSGKQLGNIKSSNSFPPNFKRTRTIIKVDQIPVTTDGKYYFKISIDDPTESNKKLITQIPIEIKIAFEATDTA
jgi:hypothetical protein